MARRKLRTIRFGSCEVRIYRDADYGQYVVQAVVNGRIEGGKEGGTFADDKEDARSTAASIVRLYRKRPACRRAV